MYDTGGTQSICRPAHADYDVGARLNWLKSELVRTESRPPTRRARDGVALIPVGRAFTTGQTYARFGMFLGLLPPAAIFFRMFWSTMNRPDFQWGLFLLVLAMNVVCCVVGRTMGAKLFRQINAGRDDAGRPSWATTLVSAALLGFVWGLATGAAGGVLFFGIGAFFGAACAIPVAVVAFPVFALLQRLVARDGMIEANRLWPLAFGVSSIIAALILSPFLIPY
ncbi:MAG: hypothetical protein WCD76_01425 [Pyrinomonadaceae bacterium]